MANNWFRPLFGALHLIVVVCALLIYLNYGLFAGFFTALIGIVVLQGWLLERRKQRKR